MKKVLAGLVLSALVLGIGYAAPQASAAEQKETLFEQGPAVVFYEGMAYREKQDDPNGMDAFNRTHGRSGNDSNNVKHDIRRRTPSKEKDDPNGMDAFNRTHGRGNDDGHDGMAWREKQDGDRGSTIQEKLRRRFGKYDKNWSSDKKRAYFEYFNKLRDAGYKLKD